MALSLLIAAVVICKRWKARRLLSMMLARRDTLGKVPEESASRQSGESAIRHAG
jgi:hypothetical protein